MAPKFYRRYCKYCGDIFESVKELDNICPNCISWLDYLNIPHDTPVDEYDIPHRPEEDEA